MPFEDPFVFSEPLRVVWHRQRHLLPLSLDVYELKPVLNHLHKHPLRPRTLHLVHYLDTESKPGDKNIEKVGEGLYQVKMKIKNQSQNQDPDQVIALQ